MKRRVLVLADVPTCNTGFARVSHNVLKSLYDTGRYEIDMIGINHDGFFDREKFKEKYYYLNKLIPAKEQLSSDLYGRELTLKVLVAAIREILPPWDIFFTIQDHFILETTSITGRLKFAKMVKDIQKNLLKNKDNRKHHFLWIGYWPVDGVLKKNWVIDAIDQSDYPVAYCNYGREQIINHKPGMKVGIIRHGTNTKDFFPISEKERAETRKKYFGELIDDKTFLIINVNRNQKRKDMARTLMVYKKFRERVKNSFLYLHCNPYDSGGNLYDVARAVGLEEKQFAVPTGFNERIGVPVEVLNKLYGAADCNLTTTIGEGWGLCLEPNSYIKTDSGYKKIKDIKIGDLVLTRNGFKEVLGTTKRKYSGDLIEITSDKRSKKDALKVTPEHLIFTNRGWVKADKLNKDDVLCWVEDNFEQYDLRIKNITRGKYDGEVCDISVNETHEFMTNHCLVHNSLTESMATKTPVFAPAITSIPEILGCEHGFDPKTSRGVTFKAGSTSSEFICLGPDDNEMLRPISNVDDAVEQLVWGYNNKDKLAEITERAYNWAVKLTWENENKKWVDLFDEACKVNDELRKRGACKSNAVFYNGRDKLNLDETQTLKKLGRNDLCPVCFKDGVRIKIKKCDKHRDVFL